MRFPVLLIAGVLCIALGLSLSEWSRRHPAEKAAVTAEKAKAAATTLPPDELLTTESPDDLPAEPDALRVADAALADQAKGLALPEGITVPGARVALGGSLFARNALARGNTLFLVVEEGKQGAKQTLVRITASDAPRALAIHRPAVGGIAVDGTKLYWAEGGALFSTDSATGGTGKGLARFPKARITSLGAGSGMLVATLVPKELDPFSSDPVGAVVSVRLSDGKVQTLATLQIRPSDAATDGASAVWVAGYPADLFSADLATHAQKTLAMRVDGPVLIDDGFVTFRHPSAGDPGLQRVPIRGGEVAMLAKGEIDRVCQFGGDVWFSVGGSLSHLTRTGADAKEVAKLPHAVLELAATDDALYALARQDDGRHLLLSLPRSTPEGSPR